MRIEAINNYDSTRPFDQEAISLANRIIDALQHIPNTEQITVSFAGVRGAGSSYYNVLLRGIVDWAGMDIFEWRIRFEFDLKPQEFVFGQSLRALRAEKQASDFRG